MNNESSTFLLTPKTLRITLYISLVVAHLLFGVLYPESITIAAVGFAFFAALVLFQLRPAHPQAIKVEETVHLDK